MPMLSTKFKGLLIAYILVNNLISCCSLDKQVESVLTNAEPEQKEELIKFIEHYANDKDRQGVAKFLVANIGNKFSIEGVNIKRYHAIIDSVNSDYTINNRKGFNYKEKLNIQRSVNSNAKILDISVVKADSLIQQMDDAFLQWSVSPWSKLYSYEMFVKYISPYRIADEPLEYYWRRDAYDRYRHWLNVYKDSCIIAACSYVYQNMDYKTNNLFWSEPLQRYSDNVKYKQGTCSDYALYTTMVMRSLGIPTSTDFIPYWGDNNNGHSFNALLMPDGTCRGYNNKEDLINGLHLSGKVSKIYRKVYEIQRNSLIYKFKNSEYIPDIFANHDIIDVTEYYDVPQVDISISPDLSIPQSRIVYLSVFSPEGWRPVAWAEYNDNKAEFKHIGVGYTSNDSPTLKGENYGEGCLYLPICYNFEQIQPLSYPFILKTNEAPRYLIPNLNSTETIILKRKFPRKKRIIDFAKKMKGGYFELSNDCDFAQSDIIYYLDSVPESRMQTIHISTSRKYRYMRFYKRNGGLSIGEFGCLDANGQIASGKVIADVVLMEDSDLGNVCDGDPLSYFDIGNLKDIWIGLDFGKPIAINSLFFCPRTDDNDVSVGDEYELFYWNNDWMSLGRKVADSYQLIYDNVPKNALLWLRNVTKGKEERPFTYKNGMQIWW